MTPTPGLILSGRSIIINGSSSDDKERLAFLTSLADKVDQPETQDAHVYALADVANVKLRLQDLDGAEKDLASCQRVLDSFDSVESVVHASFYKVNADYYHVRAADYG